MPRGRPALHGDPALHLGLENTLAEFTALICMLVSASCSRCLVGMPCATSVPAAAVPGHGWGKPSAIADGGDVASQGGDIASEGGGSAAAAAAPSCEGSSGGRGTRRSRSGSSGPDVSRG